MVPRSGDYNHTQYESSVRVKLWENRENEDYPPHWHTATEIIMPQEGDYEVTLRGKRCHLRANDILIVPSRELHQIRVPRSAQNGRRIILMFEPVLLYSLPELSGVISHLHTVNLIQPDAVPEIHRPVRQLLLDSFDEYKKHDSLRNVAIYAKIIDMYVALARYYISKKDMFPDIPPVKQQDYIARLNRAFDFIDKHISEELTLESAAAAANFSKFYFSRIFKQYTNMTFYQYLQNKRVGNAELLLLNPELTITEAALHSGFSSITTFNRVFKAIKKCLPSEYKKMCAHGI